MGAAPACEDRDRLTHIYQQASAKYNRALAALNWKIGSITKQEYERLRSFTEEAHSKLEQARTALDRHIAEHGCYVARQVQPV
jgi:hypothetical protein